MPHNRLLKAVAVILGLAVILYITISLYVPSPRRLILGVDKDSGKVRLADSGITFLPWHQFYRLSFEKKGGWAQTDGIVRINSREDVPVVLTYRLRFDIESERLPDADRLVHDGWSQWISARVGEAVSAVTRQIPIEDLASPTSAFSAQRNSLRETVIGHLARSGLRVTGFAIQRIEVDHEEYLRFKKAEVRRTSRGAVGRVAVIGLDGADWELISELVDDGRMPNIAALLKGGSFGSLQTIQPTVSPLLWTTVGTGLPPDRHGIIDFYDRTMGSPADARARRAPGLWDVAAAFGKRAQVVSWWTAWPPSKQEVVIQGTPIQFLPNAIHPPALAPKMQPLIIPEATIGYQQMRRFLNVSQSEFQKSIGVSGSTESLVTFRSVLSKTWSDHRMAIETFRMYKPDLLLMSYGGTDVVNHLFGPYHPPYRNGLHYESFRKYWPTVANYYSEIDRLIGEWIRVLPQDTTLIILSAHGMKWGKERPLTPPEGTSALSMHRNPGIFIVYGNAVAPGHKRLVVSIYDVAPTILALLGLPKSREMPGKVATTPFTRIEEVVGADITSFSDVVDIRPIGVDAALDPKAYRARLVQVGHLADPGRVIMPITEGRRPDQSPISPQQWGLYAYTNNLGVQLKREGKKKEAIEALVRATKLNPSRATPYLNLSIALFEQQHFTAAENVFFEALVRGLPNPDQYIADFAAAYREQNMTTRAINVLTRAREMFPQSFIIASSLGSALASMDRYSDALPELERALGMQPTSTLVLNNLGLIHMHRRDYSRALDYWNRSLAINPQQPKVREAVKAVETRL